MVTKLNPFYDNQWNKKNKNVPGWSNGYFWIIWKQIFKLYLPIHQLCNIMLKARSFRDPIPSFMVRIWFWSSFHIRSQLLFKGFVIFHNYKLQRYIYHYFFCNHALIKVIIFVFQFGVAKFSPCLMYGELLLFFVFWKLNSEFRKKWK